MLKKQNNTPILIGDDRLTIPSGYKIAKDTSDSIDYGIVIEDKSGNEWIWVPVENVSVMFDTTNAAEYTLCGISVKTKLYSASEIISGYTRTTPGTTSGFREPDLGTTYDANEEYYKTILGFNSTEEMAKAFVSDYKEMIESIENMEDFI